MHEPMKRWVGWAMLASLLAASPAVAQWTRVAEVQESDIFSVWTHGDTIAAGADTAVYVSTDGGATWKKSAKVADGVDTINGVRLRNGRLYAGTFGQGVFFSDDLGDTWTAFNQGLVGGIGNAQLFIKDLLVNGDKLYLATSGAGPWVRNLDAPGTWAHFGEALEVQQASNMNGIAHGGTRFLASAGFNGTVFFRDDGQSEWTRSWLDNVGAQPGLAAFTSVWTGNAWLVGTNAGVFRSALGQSPWTFDENLDLGLLFGVSFALHGGEVFATFSTGPGTVVASTADDGVTWQVLDVQDFIFTYRLAAGDDALYAGRFDGLWRRPIDTAAVPSPGPTGLRLEIAGAQPVRESVQFRFELPEAGRTTLEVFDVAGRAIASFDDARPAGRQEIQWSARSLTPGVYLVRLRTSHQSAFARFVRVQ